MVQKINKAQKDLKRAQLIGIAIYLIMAYAKRKPFWEFQYEGIMALALVNTYFVMKNVIFIARQKQYITNYSKARWLLWICGGYAFLLLLLCALELFIKYQSAA